MSTPPPYFSRFRRGAHSGEREVYLDTELHEQHVSQDATAMPARGADLRGGSSCDEVMAPTAVTARGECTPPSFDEVTGTGMMPRVSGTALRQRGIALRAESPSETTSIRSRRLASERRAARKCRHHRRVRPFFTIVLVLGLLVGASYVAYDQLFNSSTTVSDDSLRPGTSSVEVTIVENSSSHDTGQALVDTGVAKSVGAFARQFEKTPASMSARPGTHRPRQQMSAVGALVGLLDETNHVDPTIMVTLGQEMPEVKERIVDIMGVTEEQVDTAFADMEAIDLPSEAGRNAEGWLLLGSYEVFEDDIPTTVIARVVKGTIDELDRLGVAPADRRTVLIKVSIVDGKMDINKYMSMAARVIEDRLADTSGETKGYLGMDSTVLHGIGKTSGVPDQADLDNDNLYNMCLYAGLPPTPIGQSNEKAIKAVLNPTEGNWLYFVTANLGMGEILSASTLEGQEKNREQFKTHCAANPKVCTAS